MPTDREREMYPTSDDLHLVGGSWHEDALHRAREALARHFRGRDDIFLARLMALYYEQGKTASRLIPDLMVAFDVPGRGRRVYKT